MKGTLFNYYHKFILLCAIFLSSAIVFSCDQRERQAAPTTEVANPGEDMPDADELELELLDLDENINEMLQRYPDAQFSYPPEGQRDGLDRPDAPIRDLEPNKRLSPHLEEIDAPEADITDEERNRITVEGITDEEDRRILEVNLEKVRVAREKLRGRMDDRQVYYIVDTYPEPGEGFDQFRQEIARNMKIPHQAIEDGIEGEVLFQFVVDEHGNIDEVKVVREHFNIKPEGDYIEQMKKDVENAILRTSGSWKPGTYQGETVATRYNLPISFNAPDGVISAREIISNGL
jgi:hypothetical protein